MIESIQRLWRARVLVWTLARRELKARYRASFLGYLWSLLNPLLLLAIYSAVFTLIFVQRAGATRPYSLFLFGGVLSWNFLAASLLDASVTFKANGPLLRKVIISPEIFPAVSVLSQAFHLLWALPVLAAATAVAWATSSISVGWPAVQLPLVLLLLGFAVLGAALLVSSVSVHFQDLRDLLQSLLTFWFFASPVIYSPESLPPRLRFWLAFNPATPYLSGIHDSIFVFRWIPAVGWASMVGISTSVLLLGAAVFGRLRDSIAEEA
jgi:ABC-type polysaccharide/polyol phosphate export permease